MNKIINQGKLCDFFSSPFELLDTGINAGQYNMDFDFERSQAVSKKLALPMFRLYGWNPWTVSLGANQREDEIDLKKLNELGFGLVRRPTGGRAVLHANELTYSVVMQLPEGMSAHDAYREIHIILLNGFNKLGCNLEFEKSQPDFRELYKDQGTSMACFASSARWEIAWNGKKIVGSAQRVFGRTLLQHGSILLGEGSEQLADVAAIDEDKRKSLKNYLLRHSSTLEQAANRPINYSECAEVIFDSIYELNKSII